MVSTLPMVATLPTMELDSTPTPLLTEPGTSGCLIVESPEGPIRFILMSQEAYVQMSRLGPAPQASAAASSGSTSGSIWAQR